MEKKSKKRTIFLISICLFSLVLFSGCTINSNNSEKNPVLSTESSATAETIQQVVSENTNSVVSSKDFYPEYDEQTKQELIEEAKDEIIRVFPNVDRSTLEGNWEEYYSQISGIEISRPPKIVFYNVDDTSEKYLV